MDGEVAHYWRHPGVPEVDLLRARFVTHRYARHVHETYAFALIEAGVEEFEVDGSLERAGAGSVAFVNPGAVHTGQAGVPDGWTYRVLYPSVEAVAAIAADLGAAPGTPWFPEPVQDDPDTARLVRAMHRAGEQGDALAASSLFRTAVEGLLRHARSVPDGPRGGPGATGGPAEARTPRAVREARDILHESLVGPPSLEALAAAVGEGPHRLLRAFRAATGLPPHAYLNQVRVRQARRLLDGGMRPSDVAFRTGFADQAHLNRHFKRAVGVPPGAYQEGRIQLP